MSPVVTQYAASLAAVLPKLLPLDTGSGIRQSPLRVQLERGHASDHSSMILDPAIAVVTFHMCVCPGLVDARVVAKYKTTPTVQAIVPARWRPHPAQGTNTVLVCIHTALHLRRLSERPGIPGPLS
jgi:hypothetical protein